MLSNTFEDQVEQLELREPFSFEHMEMLPGYSPVPGLPLRAVETSVDLTSGAVMLMLDASRRRVFADWEEPYRLCLAAALAPHQVAFHFEESASEDLSDLQRLLEELLFMEGVRLAPLGGESRAPESEAFKHFDNLGIPHTVLMRESSLKDGVIRIRQVSRKVCLPEGNKILCFLFQGSRVLLL